MYGLIIITYCTPASTALMGIISLDGSFGRPLIKSELFDCALTVFLTAYLCEYCVADGGKILQVIVCKSPGTNIENPGDPFMTLFASLT